MRLLKLAKIMIAAAAAVFALSANSYAGAWLHDNNGWWYCNDNRSYTTDNWQQINGAWYYFDPWGYMVTGWKQVGGSWYYLHGDGKMAHDTWIDGTYYVGTDGRMLTNTTTPDGYRVGADGCWIPNQSRGWTGRFRVQNYYQKQMLGDCIVGVDYSHADNNSLRIDGYFDRLNNEYMGYMGYHSKTFTFSNSCTFWMDGGEEIGFYQITKDAFVRVVNRHNGLDLSFSVKNDVIVEAWLSS